MSIKPFKRGDHRGDTIVEVIIVLAILGSAISISYATANRSLLDARQAQEASQATELIQSQLESLRTMADNPKLDNLGNPDPNYIFPPAQQPFCLVVDNTGTSNIHFPADPGAPCHLNNLYDITITYHPSGLVPVGGAFTITATWDDVEGQGQDTASLAYNLYPTPESP
ncbi:MAG TPA: type II secretion system protein [Candidatus Saccharimonadales bacterium]